jgi:ankyrin repeat protein
MRFDIFREIKTSDWALVRQLILSNSKLLYQRDIDDNTPLHVAIENNADLELIKFLVNFGIDLNAKNFCGETALLVACRSNSSFAIIKYLVENGADLYSQTIAGPALIHYAAKASTDVMVLEYLIEKSKLDVNEPNLAENAPLNFAAQYNTYVEIIDYLIAKGANVTFEKSNGCQAIHDAASSNTNLDILISLIEKGGNIKPIQKTKMTLLQLAADSNPNPKILKYLIDNIDTNINAENLFGFTALSYAAKNNSNLEILKLLIDNGADVRQENKKGKRAIDFADTKEKKDFLRDVMLSCGLDIEDNTRIKNQFTEIPTPTISQTLNLRELVLLNQETKKEFCPYPDKAKFYFEIEQSYSVLYCNYDLVYLNPTMELLTCLINFLDGVSESSSQLLLVKSDAEYMTIYGGYNDWFVCWITLDATTDKMLNLTNISNQNTPPQYVNIAVGCEDIFQPADICNRKSILEIAQYYAIKGQPLSKYSWK